MRSLLGLAFLAGVAVPATAQQQTRIAELVRYEQAVPRRVVGYGIVVGLSGTGDRSFGTLNRTTPTIRSVVNLLRRFDITVPEERLRLRNVATVLVTAELSPFLQPGGRFEVQVASLGDAQSLDGGVLWMTPLVTDVGQTAIATAQGPLLLESRSRRRTYRRGASARIPDGGLLEVALATPTFTGDPRLFLREPNLTTAMRIANAANNALGDSTASVENPGVVRLVATGDFAGNPLALIAAVEELTVSPQSAPRLVVDADEGTVVAGGEISVGPAVVSHRGITLTIGDAAVDTTGAPAGLVNARAGATVQEIAAALHVVGAEPAEIAAIFSALRKVGALRAEVAVQ